MILVTGASGTIGARLVRVLLARGFPVRGLVLADDPAVSRLLETDCEIARGDITRPETLGRAFDDVDTVYHLAAVLLTRDESLLQRVNVQGTSNVLQASIRAGVRHFVQVSSASVVYPRSTPYSRSKREGEDTVRRSNGIAWTIVRPTLVFEREEGLEFQIFREQVLRFPVVPFVGRGDALKRPVLVDDLVSGLAAIAGCERSFGKTYNLSGGEAISLRRMARLLLERHGLAHRPILPLPVPLCRVLARGLSRLGVRAPLTPSAVAGLTQDADLNPAEACEDLGYEPRGFSEALQLVFPVVSQDRRAAVQGRT